MNHQPLLGSFFRSGRPARIGSVGLLTLFVAGLWVGCGSSPVAHSTAEEESPSAAERWQRLEKRLLAADKVSFGYDIKSTGALATVLQGTATWRGDGGVLLTGSGLFGDQAVELDLTSADGRMAGGSAAGRFDEETPPALAEALALGLTRMGLLHNLARLTAGWSPDHAATGVGDWLRMEQLEPVARGGIRFQLLVEGSPAGVGTLWLDDRGLPFERHQTVQFSGGGMKVVERYTDFVIEP
ncbi:MAG: hypothetical protein AAF481_07000 [Acidobacteriota bacterium]